MFSAPHPAIGHVGRRRGSENGLGQRGLRALVGPSGEESMSFIPSEVEIAGTYFLLAFLLARPRGHRANCLSVQPLPAVPLLHVSNSCTARDHDHLQDPNRHVRDPVMTQASAANGAMGRELTSERYDYLFDRSMPSPLSRSLSTWAGTNPTGPRSTCFCK